jgi:hypothetical protein
LAIFEDGNEAKIDGNKERHGEGLHAAYDPDFPFNSTEEGGV